MGEKPMLRVICYDIASDRVRERVARALEEVAVRVQYSVFEARLTHAQAERLMEGLSRLVEPGDSLRLYTVPDPMITRCRQRGGPGMLGAGRFWLV